MVKLSIVIPYYETYALTKKILDNLLIQMSKGVEIILIDDGCNQDFNITMLIASRLEKYDLLRIIHQKNMGVAKTRNKGIDLAKGKYIAFIDCDDMITMDYVDTLLDAIDKYDTDVINFNWYDMTDHIENRKPHNPAPWKQIYKKETMPKFREDMEYGSEDVVFQQEIDNGNYTITYLDKLLYFYNSNRQGSLIWKKIHKEDI